MERVLKLARTVIVTLDTMGELLFAERVLRRRMSSWWAGVERRERQRIHRAELDFVDELTGRYTEHPAPARPSPAPSATAEEPSRRHAA